jgi:hypothetical protein
MNYEFGKKLKEVFLNDFITKYNTRPEGPLSEFQCESEATIVLIRSLLDKKSVFYSSLNVFDDGAVLLQSIIWTYPSSLCFAPTLFRGMALPSSSGETYSVGSGRSS